MITRHTDPDYISKLTLMVEAGFTTHQMEALLGTSAEAMWHTWARVTDRSVWSLRQIARLHYLPGGVLPTLAQCKATDVRVIFPKGVLSVETN